MAEGIRGSAANITHYLKNIDFPASKEDLVRQAQQNQAEQDVLQILRAMPDEKFNNMAEVMATFGQMK